MEEKAAFLATVGNWQAGKIAFLTVIFEEGILSVKAMDKEKEFITMVQTANMHSDVSQNRQTHTFLVQRELEKWHRRVK